MTTTLEPSVDLSPQQRVDAWLADFEAALAVRDVPRAAAKFATDSFWRDLVAFTWNIKTVEGRDGVADLLTERLADTDPSGFRTREAPVQEGSGRRQSRPRSSSSRPASAVASGTCASRATRPGPS